MLSKMLSSSDFNPLSDERSDAQKIKEIENRIEFQSTLRRTERRVQLCVCVIDCDFNPRSDERSDRQQSQVHKLSQISIHAPTNGATHYIRTTRQMIAISIHAPTNGATQTGLHNSHKSQDFNPRSDERSDSKTPAHRS